MLIRFRVHIIPVEIKKEKYSKKKVALGTAEGSVIMRNLWASSLNPKPWTAYGLFLETPLWA